MTLDLVRVEVAGLIGLSESMMVSDACSIISEAAKVRLWPLLLLDSNCHDFDLVVGKADLNFELVGHNKFISFNRIVVVLLLLSDLVTLLHHLILHLLLLLELLWQRKKVRLDVIENLSPIPNIETVSIFRSRRTRGAL